MPNEKQKSKPIVEAEVAVSITIPVEVEAPEGYESMSEEEREKWAEDNKYDLLLEVSKKLPTMQEWKDASQALQMAVAYHRGKYGNAKAEYTPLLGAAEIIEI